MLRPCPIPGETLVGTGAARDHPAKPAGPADEAAVKPAAARDHTWTRARGMRWTDLSMAVVQDTLDLARLRLDGYALRALAWAMLRATSASSDPTHHYRPICPYFATLIKIRVLCTCRSRWERVYIRDKKKIMRRRDSKEF